MRSTLTVDSELSLAGIWLAMAASAALGASSLYERDQRSGRLELYQLLPAGFESLVLGKWFAFFLALALPMLLIVPLFVMLGDGEGWIRLTAGLALGAANMSLVACFAASLMAGGGRGSALLSLISLPLMVPIMIFGTAYCREGDAQSLTFLIAYGLFLLPMTIIASAAALRASN